jgi:glycosyltransferase involved in cell wall biosynthesis
MISAVFLDNGEELIEQSVSSISGQVDEVVVASGPKTDLALARRLANVVTEPTGGTGSARVRGIAASSGDLVLTCDTDTIYQPGYARAARRALDRHRSVMAGRIMPYEDPVPGSLAWIESSAAWAIPYEFALGFRRDALEDSGILSRRYDNPRIDIGPWVARRLPPLPVFSMRCRTRMPTYYARLIASYVPALAGASIPIALAGAPLVWKALSISVDKALREV